MMRKKGWSKFLVPGIAGLMFLFAVNHVVKARQVPPKLPPPVEPAHAPFSKTLAASGIVEARTENIAVGSHLSGVVEEVFVKVGQQAPAGTPLFRLDDRALQAELKMRLANLAAAKSQLDRLSAMPRPEEVPPSEAKVREAKANFDNWEDQLQRSKSLFETRAIGEEELIRVRQQRQVAFEQHERAKAELKLLKAGAWEPEKTVARAQVQQMQAQVEMTRTDLDRLTVKAPVDGEALQVNVRPGEFVSAAAGSALVVLGNIDRLHVRVDIDENDIHRFRPGLPAEARLRGDPKQKFTLRFVRVEPFVIPKKSLTGANVKRIDTRVLQVIYAIEPGGPRVYVGQQLDVYLDSEATPVSPGD
jgi:multidrug resistance efflux pump